MLQRRQLGAQALSIFGGQGFVEFEDSFCGALLVTESRAAVLRVG